MKLMIRFAGALLCAALSTTDGFGQSASPRTADTAGPAAIATNADVNYCFARLRGLDPGHQPPAYLVLQLRVTIAFRNAGTRPLIVPLEHDRTIFTGLMPDEMSIYKERVGFFDPGLGVMKTLPARVGPDSPIDPPNDVFSLIPAGGEMTPPLIEEITVPLNRKNVFKPATDARGHKIYIKLRFLPRQLSPALKADLTNRWSKFGALWTGPLTTNAILIDVPADPQASPCKDEKIPEPRNDKLNTGK